MFDNFVERLLDMQLLLMKKKAEVYFYVVGEFHHLQIMSIVYRDKRSFNIEEGQRARTE